MGEHLTAACNVGLHLPATPSDIGIRPVAVKACNQPMHQNSRLIPASAFIRHHVPFTTSSASPRLRVSKLFHAETRRRGEFLLRTARNEDSYIQYAAETLLRPELGCLARCIHRFLQPIIALRTF